MSRTSWKSTGARAVLPGLIALAAALLFQCQPFALRNILDGASRSSLTISPSTMIIPVNKVVSFTASGGVAPYTFSLVSGVGQLTDPVAGTYDALGVPGSAVIRVTDKAGKTVDAQITVESAGVSIGISPSAITVKVNTTVTFTAFGGSVPYSFSVFSGGGTINSATGVYTVPSVAGSAIVRVTDFGGGTADSAVTIDATGQTLALSPSSIQLAASSDATFAAVGGVPPYTYSILSAGSGSPAINSGTGFYTAGVNPGVDTVEVRDSAVPIAGSATASVTVVTLATNVDYRVPSTSLVGSATVGASGVAGGSFVVSNNGTGSGTLTVFWKVYLSVNNQLDGGDTIVASGSTAALAAGASAPVSPTVSLPVVTPGSYYLIAEVEALDDLVTNNNAGAASPLTLGPQNINYDVPSPVSPGSGTIAGQAMTGSFKVHNGGTASGLASVNWRAYASADATLDAGDYLLAAGSTAALPAGITSGSIGFSGIWPTSPGTYYLIVSVSADDEPAGNAGNNWTASAPVTITGAPPANVDYIVAAVNLPSPTTAGKPFTATFTYKNQGSAAGSQDVFWTAYLSADTTLQLGTDLVVDSGKIVGGALPANTGSGPVGFGGTWPAVPATAYLIVIVYAPEDIAPANNSLTGSAVTTTAPNINYKVLSVSNSTGTVAGDSFTEDLTVQNYGADGGASDAYWTAYLSLDGTLDAGDQMIDWGTITGGLASGASSALISFKGTRPVAANTTYWLIVKVSASDEPAGNAGDNWKASSSATTTAPDVDYAPNTPGSPAVVTAGAAFSGTFTITNSGGHDGTQSVPWRIYVSSDAVWDAGDQIADSGVIASPGLAKGATSAALSFNGVWPASLTPQTYYLIAKTFAGDDIAAGNNEKASAAIVVNPLNVNYAVSNPTVPAGALAGAPLAQSFTFQKLGTATGTAGVSYEVYASPGNTTLGDAGDTLVSTGSLGVAPASQTVNYSGTWPSAGSYYLVVRITASDDINPGDNVAASAAPVVVIQPVPDYSITSVPLPAGNLTGQTVNGSFTLKNNGTTTGVASVDWYVYASPGNGTYDTGDTLLATGSFAGLGVGATKTQAYAGTWPSAAGSYNIIVRAQTADQGLIPDAASAAVMVNTPDVNYAVASPLPAPANAFAGAVLAQSFTFQKLGTDSGTAAVSYEVYASPGNTTLGDAGDILIASGSLGVNPASQTVNYGGTWPTAGSYYLVARIAATDDITSGDNIAASAAPVSVSQSVPSYSITAVPAPTPPYQTGKAATGAFTVKNNGTAAGVALVNWYVYASLGNGTYDTGDTLLAVGSFAALAAGASTTPAPTYAGTWPSTAGNYNIIVRLQTADQAVIPDASSVSFAVNQPDVNYAVSNPTAPATALAGAALAQSFTFQNLSIDPGTAALTWEVYASPGNTTLGDAGDILIASGSLGVAPVSQTVNYGGTWPSAAGSYYLVARIAASDDINPGDNLAASAAPVAVSLPVPNYSITSVPLPTGNQTGLTVSGTFTVKNNGISAGVAPVNWYVYASLGNNTYDTGDTLLAAGSFAALGAGASATPAPTYAGTWPSTAGNYNIIVRLQTADQAVIPDAASAAVAVSNPPPPDYMVSFDANIPWSGVVSTPMLATGTTQITITNTSANPGHAGISWAIYLSTDQTLDGTDTMISQGITAALGASPASVAINYGAAVNWPAAAGLYFVIATVRAADDSNTTNDVKAGHAAAVGTYRYAEVQGFDNSGTGPKVNGPNDAKTSDTGLNGATQLGVGQTLAIEGVMDATGEYDTYKFTTSNSVSAVLYARTMWSTGLDDIDFHIWDQVTTTDFFSNSAGIDTEPLYSPYGVTLPSGRPCYVGVYMYMAGKTAGDPADSGKKYVVLVSLQ